MTLKDELIQAIQNEANQFDMGGFCLATMDANTGVELPPSCDTALCMAGWIMALRQEKAKELITEELVKIDGVGIKYISAVCDYATIAGQIWEEELGERCRLDFYGKYAPTTLDELDRRDALDHIQGQSVIWPLLPAFHNKY